MKKILFTLFALVLASGIAAQIPEPDFIGEVLAIHSDGTAEKLEKHNVKMRTGAGVYIAGLAVNKSKTKILVAGSQANVRFAADEPGQSDCPRRRQQNRPDVDRTGIRHEEQPKTTLGSHLGRRFVQRHIQRYGVPALYRRKIRRKLLLPDFRRCPCR